MLLRRTLLPLLVLAAPAAIAGPSDIILPVAERSALSLTLHQDGAALVRDRRPVVLEKGGGILVLEGLPRTLRPGGLSLRAPGVTVWERRIDPGGLTAERQLAAHLGRNVGVIWSPGAAPEAARVLSAEGMPLFEIDGKVTAGLPLRIVYDSLAPGLRPLPALRARIEAESAGRREVELTYAADGLSWTSHAEGELKGDRLLLTVWAELSNGAGADFVDAAVKLTAGATQAAGGGPVMMMKAPMRAMAETTAPRRDAVGPFHVYTLPHPVTLRDGGSVEVPLLPAAEITVRRELVLGPQSAAIHLSRVPPQPPLHPTLTVSFVNTKAAGLGMPLPAGPIRVGMRGPGGDPILLGEDMLSALPEGAEARLSLGQAFDVTARRVQTDFQKVSAEVTESAWEVRIANGGDRAESVTVRDSFRGDWLVVDESIPHVREDAATPRWNVSVPAKGEATLRYRIRVK